MTDEQTVAAITRILVKSRLNGADPDWTARTVITRLRNLSWRPTEARPPEPWQRRDVPPAEPTAEYLAARPPSREDTHGT